jgi:hypothetical protein
MGEIFPTGLIVLILLQMEYKASRFGYKLVFELLTKYDYESHSEELPFEWFDAIRTGVRDEILRQHPELMIVQDHCDALKEDIWAMETEKERGGKYDWDKVANIIKRFCEKHQIPRTIVLEEPKI